MRLGSVQYSESGLNEEIGDHPIVGDIRGEGLMIGVELVADRETKQELGPGPQGWAADHG